MRNASAYNLYFARCLAIFILCLGLASCSKKIHFNRSEIVPAADGSIKVKNDNNGNYSINVNVIHLAAPEQLTPAKKTYVVWVNTREHGQKNLGKLAIHTGLFSKSLKGSLQAVTPYKPESIYITAEDEGNRTYPGPQVVLTTGTLN